MKLLLPGAFPDAQVAALQEVAPGSTFVRIRSAAEQLTEIVGADAIYGWPRRDALALARRLRWVHVGGAGIEHIRTLPELVDSDVVLTNGRGTMALSVADHAFGFILSFTRRLRELDADQRGHRWQRDLRIDQMRELTGAVLGVVGLGQIGSAVARRGAGFEMRVVAVDVGAPPKGQFVDELWGLDRLDALLGLADYLVVCLPYTPETHHLLDRRRLRLLKPSAHLFVVSRGGIVDEEALVEALPTGRLAGAGLDATEREPLPDDCPLWEVPNLIISPHCSGRSPQTFDRLWELLRENVRRFAAGEPLLNVCDKRAGF